MYIYLYLDIFISNSTLLTGTYIHIYTQTHSAYIHLDTYILHIYLPVYPMYVYNNILIAPPYTHSHTLIHIPSYICIVIILTTTLSLPLEVKGKVEKEGRTSGVGLRLRRPQPTYLSGELSGSNWIILSNLCLPTTYRSYTCCSFYYHANDISVSLLIVRFS